MIIQKFDGLEQCWYGAYPAGSFISNQFFLKLNSEDFLVISPGTNLVPAVMPEEIHPKGALYLLAPNTFHHMGLKKWMRFFPQARCFGHSQALGAFQKKGYELEPVNSLQEMLPSHIQAFELPGTRTGEIIVMVQEGSQRLWLSCDSFFNLKRLPEAFFVRLFLQLCGSGPGLRISRLFQFLGITDRRAFKKWMLEHLLMDAPNALVVCHGSPLYDHDCEGSLKERLLELVQDRL